MIGRDESMASGIRDKVAILGMGCSRFGERWNMGAEELLVEAFQECLADAGIEKDRIEAAWFGHCIEEIGLGKIGDAARGGPPASPHRHHPDGKLLRHGDGGLPGGRLRGRLRGLRHLPRDRRGKAQGHRLRGPPERRLRLRLARLAVVPQRLGAGPLRPARLGLRREIPRLRQGPQAGDRPRLDEEPRQRRPQPQGPPAEGRDDGADPGRPDHRPPAGALRLLRRQRRVRLRDRDDAGDRQIPREEGPRLRQGDPACRLQRLRGGLQRVGRGAFRDDEQVQHEGLRGGGDHESRARRSA